jgi:hypothetical protein
MNPGRRKLRYETFDEAMPDAERLLQGNDGRKLDAGSARPELEVEVAMSSGLRRAPAGCPSRGRGRRE